MSGNSSIDSPLDGSPRVVEKILHELRGDKRTVFYACGPRRDTLGEARQDAQVFARLQSLADALKLIEGTAPAPNSEAKKP